MSRCRTGSPRPHVTGSVARTRLVLAAACICLLVAACANLPPISSNVCGNGVRDPDEDCDSFSDPELGTGTMCGAPSDTTRACRYVCSQTQPCPIGWACGVDGICRYSSGVYKPSPDTPLQMDTDQIEVARFDRDAFPDLLGVFGPNIELRLGGADGRFFSQFQTATDFPSGPVVLGDLDLDHKTDVVVPLQTGILVMRGSDQGTLDPIAYSTTTLRDVRGGVQSLPVRADEVFPFQSTLFLVGECMTFSPDSTGEASACASPDVLLPAGKLAEQIVGRIPRGNLKGGPAEELALAFKDDNRVFLYRVFNASTMPVDIDPVIELLGTIQLDHQILDGVRFADLDGDGDQDILVSVVESAPGEGDQVEVAFNDGTGRFADADNRLDHTKVDPIFVCLADPCVCSPQGCDAGQIVPSGERRWPLAVGPLDVADKRADFVNTNGMFLRTGPTTVRQTFFGFNSFSSTEAVIADFNRDNIPDIAAVTFQDGVDFYIGIGDGLFNPTHVDTADVPFDLRVGDFDGDLVQDLAIGEHGTLSHLGDDSISVLFGRLQGAPQPPVSMGRLRYIKFMEPGNLIAGFLNFDVISDLLVQSSSAPDSGHDPSLAQLIGSPQRRLLSPFVLSTGTDTADVPDAVLIGSFTSDTIPDLIAVTAQNFWTLKGAGAARFNPQDARFDNLSPLLGSEPERFDTSCSLWAAGNLDGKPPDEIVGVDRGYGCGSIDSTARPHVLIGSTATGKITATVAELPGGLATPIEVKLVDLDGDTFLDLIVVFDGGNFDGGGHGVMVYWGSMNGIDLTERSPLPTPLDGNRATSVAAINADADKQLELAVLTDSGVYIANLAATAHQFEPQLQLAVPVPGGGQIVSSDVNADGIDDLIFTDRSGSVYVYMAQQNTLGNRGP